MVKARRMVSEHLQLVDVVVELIDARIPAASRNPEIGKLIGGKPRLILLNKADLADPVVTRQWLDFFQESGDTALAVAASDSGSLKAVPLTVSSLAKPALEKWQAKRRLPRAPRLMIVGIPNVGKSTLINRLVGKKRLTVADRPGVTRKEQWVRLREDLDLLDMPGILMPRIGDEEVGLKLAATGAISDAVFSIEAVTLYLLGRLSNLYPGLLCKRFQLNNLPDDVTNLLQEIGIRRGALLAGGKVDTLRAAQQCLDEFRDGRIGRISLELPNR